MGEVYRATDTKLKRQVAIKILPPDLVADRDRLARFQREAEVLASLNHPNIAAIYGLEESEGITALVMELVEGDDLSQRIARGAIPIDEALPIAKQIAEALEAAHEQGIIHRDLKPANIKVRADGTVKVLDFGLAKAMEPAAGSSPSMSMAPTITTPALMTGAGMILGTAAYMSPEQARGKAVDKRADIWAFGAVLFEMLTGKRAFEGEDVGQTLARVVEREPDFGALPPSVPARVSQVLRVCLRKDPKQRVGDIRDVRLALEGAFETGVSQVAAAVTVAQPAAWRRALPVAFALVVGSVLTGLAVWNLRPAPPSATSQTVARMTVALPADAQLVVQQFPAIAVSPNGGHVVFVASRGGIRQLYVRAMDSLDSTPLVGTEGALVPFFSPDSQWVGFFADGKMKKIPVTGGASQILCDAAASYGGSWGEDDVIYFAPGSFSGLWRVAANGGTPAPVTTLQGEEISHRWPQVLPGGQAVLFTSRTGPGNDEWHVQVQRLSNGERRVLAQGATGHYVPTGHLVYVEAATGTLVALPFDLTGLQVGTAAPVAVAEGILMTGEGADYSLSSSGLLTYVTGGSKVEDRTLVWVDRNGKTEPLPAPARSYEFPRISPDDGQVAFNITAGRVDLWLYDLARGTASRLASEASSQFPLWTPDGKRLTYRATRGGTRNIFWRTADGSGSEERLTTGEGNHTPGSWSPDGQTLLFNDSTAGQDIFAFRLVDHTTQPWLKSPFNETIGRFSPDGRWVAYVSDESGRQEIYLQPYPGPGGKVLISTDGGVEPVWNPNGRELFYRSGNAMMAVDIAAKPAFVAGRPTRVFAGDYVLSGVSNPNYDVSPDGRRFLMVQPSAQESATPSQLNVVLNSFEQLKAKVPAK